MRWELVTPALVKPEKRVKPKEGRMQHALCMAGEALRGLWSIFARHLRPGGATVGPSFALRSGISFEGTTVTLGVWLGVDAFCFVFWLNPNVAGILFEICCNLNNEDLCLLWGGGRS